jgi:hypothetical protein
MDRVIEQLRTDAKVAKILRDRLARQLEEEPSMPWSDLTEQEQNVVKALGSQRMTGEELAEKLDVAYSGPFKTMLSTLVKRRILANAHPGYRVLATFLEK